MILLSSPCKTKQKAEKLYVSYYFIDCHNNINISDLSILVQDFTAYSCKTPFSINEISINFNSSLKWMKTSKREGKRELVYVSIKDAALPT